MPRDIRAKCLYDGVNNSRCPNNEDGICKTVYISIEGWALLLHEFDGKNYIKCLCG